MAYVKKVKPVEKLVVTKESEVIREDVAKEVLTPIIEDGWKNRVLAMDYEFQLISMMNGIKILPPNLIKDGRHLRENIQAICGFTITEEMMDEVYKDFTHESI
jgi:hypothetical protein